MKGFSLLEIMVVVAIVAIMASSVVIGFNSFGATVRVRETAGVVTDTIKHLELETIRRDYQKNTVNFEENYLVVETEVGNSSLPLTWTLDGCTSEDVALEIDTASLLETAYLAKRDQYGNNLEISSYDPGGELETECVPFYTSDEIEWQYQLFTGTEVSDLIRFIHFNIRRGATDLATIDQGTNDYSLKISAPYAKKVFYDGATEAVAPVKITLTTEDSSETITLQK